MTTTAPDVAAQLQSELRTRLGSPRAPTPGGLFGLEHEFTVRMPNAWPVDFREVLPQLDLPGVALDPSDPHARRTASGVVVTADGPEAEVAVPPIPVDADFGHHVGCWSRAARRELVDRLPDEFLLEGYSTHLNVAVGDVRNVRLGALYARAFAAGLMLLVDRKTSPGLIVRPRPGRTELCGEFVDGPWLRAAATYAAGSVRACHEALRGDRSFASLPAPLVVTTRPAAARAGWFVDRTAFGVDLLGAGRAARLRRCDGRRVSAQDHLEAAWTVARSTLDARAHADDMALVDAFVGGARTLPHETDPAALDAGEPGPLPPSSPLGDVARTRIRPGFTVDAVTATWDTTVFCIRARDRHRRAFVTIPRASLASFLRNLDELVDRYLALDAANRPSASSGGDPSIGDLPPSVAEISDHDAARRIDEALGRSSRGIAKWSPGVIVPGPAVGPLEPQSRGCLPPVGRWIAALTATALVAGGAYVATRDDDSTTTGLGLSHCGTDVGASQVMFDSLTPRCDYSLEQRSGTAYPFDTSAWDQATVNSGGQTRSVVVGETCKIHDATTTERMAAADPLTGFVGLSLIGVGLGGLNPAALVQIGATAPDGVLRTGAGVADAAGYAEVRIPINIPGPHVVRSAMYFPSGNPAGASTPIPVSSIGSNGVLDGSFPSTRCDRSTTLARVPQASGPGPASGAARDAAVGSANLFYLFGALTHPGAVFEVGGPYTVTQSGETFAVDGNGSTVDLRTGVAPVARQGMYAPLEYHGGVVVGPGAPGSARAWDRAFPCGPGQLAFTVCASNEAPLEDGTYVAVYAVLPQPLPLVGTRSADYSFTVNDTTYTLDYDRGARSLDGWSLRGADPRARAFVRNDTLVLLVPASGSQPNAYRIGVRAGSERDTQPPASAAQAAVTDSVAVASPPGRETPQQFLSALGTAITNGDAAFLRARLHPAVIERYGAATCDTYTAERRTPVQFTVVEVRAPTTYAWTTDGQTTDVANTNDVVVTQVTPSASTTRVVHIALVGKTWRWFTDCTP
jgi:hypothetical protein